jgi:hypothetical protein
MEQPLCICQISACRGCSLHYSHSLFLRLQFLLYNMIFWGSPCLVRRWEHSPSQLLLCPLANVLFSLYYRSQIVAITKVMQSKALSSVGRRISGYAVNIQTSKFCASLHPCCILPDTHVLLCPSHSTST